MLKLSSFSFRKIVIKIKTKDFIIYSVLIGLLILAIVLNLVAWIGLAKYKRQYNDLLKDYYGSDWLDEDDEDIVVYGDTSNYSCNLSVTGDKTSIQAGESITYEIKATNISAEQGIGLFQATVDYDSNLFDCKADSDDNGDWTKWQWIDGELIMSNPLGSAEDQVIAKLTFTAKQGIQEGIYKVEISNIEFTSNDSCHEG